MPKTAAKIFKATLVHDGTGLNWTIVHVPREITDAWKATKLFPVKGEICCSGLTESASFAFRTSLFPTGKGDFILLVNKTMQKNAKVTLGSVALLRIEPDEEAREVEITPELKKAFIGSSALRKWYEDLPYSFRKYVTDEIRKPKSAEAKERRADRMAEILYAMKEAETELPPILEAAFVRTPIAREGWEKMTPAQRRGHVWGIFYYQSPESRQKRADKAVAEAVKVAESK
jgi:uncharacterized protein YdeI (YjbR/CyaY-like superfamily)